MHKRSVTETIGDTPLIELETYRPRQGVRLFGKLENANPSGSVKDRTALAMVERAEEDGSLTHGDVLLEPTSGNMGISLALVGTIKGYQVHVVMPDNATPERTELLRAYGVRIDYSPAERGTIGTIELAEKLAARDDRCAMLYQYANPANPDVHYRATGAEIIRSLPDVTHFVAGLGSGGTLMGVGRRLKEHNPDTRVIAAVPLPGERLPGLRNPSDGFLPPVIDLELLDDVVEVSVTDSHRCTAGALRKEGLFVGPSSGAVLAVMERLALQLDSGNVVGLLADDGWRYLSSGIWSEA